MKNLQKVRSIGTALRSIAQLSLLAAVAMLALSTSLRAQTPGEPDAWATWWFGIFGGANYTMPSGEITGLNPGITPASSFTEGNGIGPALGGVIEYNSGSLLGFTMLLGYDARPIKFSEVQTTLDSSTTTVTEQLSTKFSYLSLEPSLRINLGSRFFHLLIGPTVGFNLGKGSEYTIDSTGSPAVTSADMQNVRGVLIGAQAGLGYDIALRGADANTQILLTPFVQFHLGLQNVFDNTGTGGTTTDLKMNTIRGGLQLKFGSRPSPAVIKGEDGKTVAYNFRVDAPVVIAESRRVEETFPLRNYLFFEPGNTALPARYTRLSKTDAESFREEQLMKAPNTPNPGTGKGDRSVRQMQVYYNALNIYGDRLRRNPSARITLTGSANGDATKGKEMAENVKSYLVQTFGIAADRIKTAGAAMPPHKSGSGGSLGEDQQMIDVENWRVELSAEPMSILDPVEIVSLEEQPIGNDVVFRVNGDDRVQSVSIAITERDGATRTFGPYNGKQDVRIDAREILNASAREGRFTAISTYTLTDGTTYESKPQEFRLVRADPDEEQTGIRYSILFEFDQSKTVQTYEQFLRETVAPTIPNGANVIIHGHTDVIGKPEYNDELSNKRVDEARRILTDALTKMGRKVTFDSSGFGENTARAPFANSLPEQRYYNRTVIIEIVPGG